ncbi:TRAP transporter, DctM subunit [Tistlia consotensis]|uniref:TRAP transporter large permease protein n=1 Tax=Tistlia consotensis USBA 355 TaxID=560819 RepID=A0A1Y6BAA2_9PROT|nr:TRAP transporter large permease [Tistlia consotensis]SME89919.1 TRAP transporter, DctM subunit [Tistlia consotensis USBA 355]SNR26430.1 TRAP transporter, DctM subunit [Tistlia consotensis]
MATLLLIGVFVALLLIGAPIAVSLGLAGAAAVAVGLDLNSVGMIGTNAYASIAKYPLIAIPLFVLTGMVFDRSGVAGRLVVFAQAIVGPRRGGLAVVATLVCMLMGGMSGSGPADAAAVATIMIPSMMRAGYPREFSASVIAASASTAILIPPSIALIVYSILVPGTDLRALFAAGVLPGVLAGVAIILPTLLLSRRHDFGAAEEQQRPAFWPSLRDAVPGLLAPVIILGGLRSGLFTPTEAASVAVAYGFLVGLLVYRNMGWADVWKVLADSAETSAVIMVIISLAGLFAWAGSTLGAFDQAAQAILAVSGSGLVVLILVMILLLFAGMVLDGVSIYLITLPLLVPIAAAFHWNLTWFGVLMAMNIAIGQFTPPVAVNLMVTARISRVPMEATVPWVLWLVLSMATAMLLVILFPEIALWLPRLLGYRV